MDSLMTLVLYPFRSDSSRLCLALARRSVLSTQDLHVPVACVRNMGRHPWSEHRHAEALRKACSIAHAGSTPPHPNLHPLVERIRAAQPACYALRDGGVQLRVLRLQGSSERAQAWCSEQSLCRVLSTGHPRALLLALMHQVASEAAPCKWMLAFFTSSWASFRASSSRGFPSLFLAMNTNRSSLAWFV